MQNYPVGKGLSLLSVCFSDNDLFQSTEVVKSDYHRWKDNDWSDYESHDHGCWFPDVSLFLHPLHLGYTSAGGYHSDLQISLAH